VSDKLDPAALEAAHEAAYLEMDARDLVKRLNAGMSGQEAVRRLLRTAIPEAITAYLAALPQPAEEG
jgi:hypothetical protein